MELNKEKMIREERLARLEKERQENERTFELEKLKESGDEDHNDDDKHSTHSTASFRGGRGPRGPKMPPFDETRDNMDVFLHRFEIYAKAQDWKASGLYSCQHCSKGKHSTFIHGCWSTKQMTTKR